MTDEQRDDAELPEEAEGLLRDWPMAERDDADWEALAQKTVDAASGADDATDDALLDPPLPVEAGEPGADGEPEGEADDEERAPPTILSESSRGLEETSEDASARPEEAPDDDAGLGLAAIARKAVVSSGSKDETDIVKASLSVAATARQQMPAPAPAKPEPEPELEVEPEPIDEEEVAEAAPAQTVRSHGESIAEDSSGAARPRVVQLPPPHASEAKRTGVIVLAMMAVAAGTALVMKMREPTGPVAVSMESTLPKPNAAAAAPAPAKAAEATAATAQEEAPGFISLDDLPTEAELKAKKRGDRRAVAQKSAPRAKGAAPNQAPGPPPAAVAGKQAPTGFEEDPALTPAAQPTDLPQRPSTGAVQAAVASVMTGAQMCLAGQEESAKATVTFSSNGTVSGVSVDGPAAACIKAAVARAKVSPFAEPTFSARFTVRPP